MTVCCETLEERERKERRRERTYHHGLLNEYRNEHRRNIEHVK